MLKLLYGLSLDIKKKKNLRKWYKIDCILVILSNVYATRILAFTETLTLKSSEHWSDCKSLKTNICHIKYQPINK